MNTIKVGGDKYMRWDRIKNEFINSKTNLTKKMTKETKQYEYVATFGTPGAPKPSKLLCLKTELTHLN